MKQNQKGFTLSELLVVVGIIAILFAIAVPFFTSGLEKSRESTDIANVRSAYADILAHFTENGQRLTVSVPVHQRVPGWQVDPRPTVIFQLSGVQREVSISPKTDGSYTVTIDEKGCPVVN